MPVELLTGLGPVSFRRLSVDPPSAHYVTSDEFLNIRTVADHTGPLLYLRVRLLRPSGELVELERTYRADGMFMFGEWNLRLTQGFLLSIACSTDVLVQRGRQWVKVELRHGDPRELSPARVLISDYVSKAVPISWPEGPLRNPFDGRGYIRNPILGLPAAGSNFLLTVPTYAHWRVHTWHMIFNTAAVAGNRYLDIEMDLGSGRGFHVRPIQAQAGTATQRYTWSTAFGSQQFTVGVHHIPLPKDLILPGGARIRTAVAGMKGGDVFTDGGMILEEWRVPF